MSIDIDVRGNTNPLIRDVDAAVKRINRSGGIKIRIDEKGVTQPLGNMRRSADEFTKSLEASNARVLAFGASVGIINAVSDAFKGLVTQTIKVEKNLTDINVVMGLTAKELDKFGSGLFKVAAETGAGFQSASEAATEFARQGLSVAETLKRTKDALILTRLTGMKSTEAVKSLTAAMNTFKGEVKSSTELVSKFAAVDVKFAVSAQDFADAIARAGQAARDAGVDINELIGMVTAAQERTARGGAVIGNSFKTIFTRVQRSSTLGQLEDLGVAVRDLQGKTLPAMKILKGLAERYDSLTDAQRSYISQNVAGVFQINILKAALADLGKANSIVAQATGIASAATDESNRKNEQLRQTMDALATETGVAIQQLAKSIGDIALAPGINKVLDGIKSVAEWGTSVLGDGEKEGNKFAKGLLAGVGNFLTGPGLVVLTAVVAKLFANALKYGAQSLSSLLNANKAANNRKNIEQSLMMVMSQNAAIQKEMLRTDLTRVEKEKMILGIIRQQTIEAQKLSAVSRSMTSGLMKSGVGPNLVYNRKGSAGGHVPNTMEASEERRQAQQGGYTPGNIRAMNIPGHGPVVYNSAEKVKKFNGMSEPAIMPPQGSKAGQKYKDKFADQHGFNPYASYGFIPNFSLEAINSGLRAGVKFSKWTKSRDKLSPANKAFLKDWEKSGQPMSGRGYQGAGNYEHPTLQDVNEFISKNTNYENLEKWKPVAPHAVKAKQEKNIQSKQNKFNKKIGAGGIDLKHLVGNIGQLGVMLGSGNQTTSNELYSQKISSIGSGSPAMNELRKYFQKKGYNKIGKELISYDKKPSDPEGIKKWNKVWENKKGPWEQFKNKEIIAKLPTRAMYPIDTRDESDVKNAIGKGKLTNTLRGTAIQDLSDGMEKFANSIWRQLFGAQNRPQGDTPAIDHITQNNAVMGGILEAGISAALAEKVTENPGRSFDFQGSSAKTLSKWMGNEALRKIELKVSGGAADNGDIPKKVLNQISGKAYGHIPNFSMDAPGVEKSLENAITREHEAGVPVSKIRVGAHKALANKSNPLGLGITNTDDEPNGLKDVVNGRGFVPNFVMTETTPEKISGAFGSSKSIERANKAAEDLAKEEEGLAKTIRDQKDHREKANSQKQEARKLEKDLTKEVKKAKRTLQNQSLTGQARKEAEAKLTRAERDLEASQKMRKSAIRESSNANRRLTTAEKRLEAVTKNLRSARNTAQRRERRNQGRGMGGMMAMMGADMIAGQMQQSGSAAMQQGGAALSGASMGASMGMMLGPWGAGIGAAVGGLYSFANASKEAAKALAKVEISNIAAAETKLLGQANQIFSKILKTQEGKSILQQPVGQGDLTYKGDIDYVEAMKNRGLFVNEGPDTDGALAYLKNNENIKYTGDSMGNNIAPESALFAEPRPSSSSGNYGKGVPVGPRFKIESKQFFESLSENWISSLSDAEKKMFEDESSGVRGVHVPTIEFLNKKAGKKGGEDRNELPVAKILAAVTNKDNPMHITKDGLKKIDDVDEDEKEKVQKITKAFIKESNQLLENMKKFSDADYSTMTIKMKEFQEVIGHSGPQALKLNEGFALAEGKLRELELKEKTGGEKEQGGLEKIRNDRKIIETSRNKMVEVFIENLSDDFEELMQIGDKEILVNKKSLLKMMEQSEQHGIKNELATNIITILNKNQSANNKILKQAERQLSSATIVANLQSQQISIMSSLNKEILGIKHFYAKQKATLGNAAGPQLQMNNKFNQQREVAEAKYYRSLKDLDLKYKEKMIGDIYSKDAEVKTRFQAEAKQNLPQINFNDTTQEEQQRALLEVDSKEISRIYKDSLGESPQLIGHKQQELQYITQQKTLKAKKEEEDLQIQHNQDVEKKNLENIELAKSRNRIAENINRQMQLHMQATKNQQILTELIAGDASSRSGSTVQELLNDDIGKTARGYRNNKVNQIDSTASSMHKTISDFATKNNIQFSNDQMSSIISRPGELESYTESQLQAKNVNIEESQIKAAKELTRQLNHQHEVLIQNLDNQQKITAETIRQSTETLNMTTGPQAFQNGMEAYGKAAQDRLSNFKYQMGQEIPATFSKNMSSAMMKVIREGGSVGDAMLEALMGTLDAINQKYMDKLMDSIFASGDTSVNKENFNANTLGSISKELAAAISEIQTKVNAFDISPAKISIEEFTTAAGSKFSLAVGAYEQSLKTLSDSAENAATALNKIPNAIEPATVEPLETETNQSTLLENKGAKQFAQVPLRANTPETVLDSNGQPFFWDKNNFQNPNRDGFNYAAQEEVTKTIDKEASSFLERIAATSENTAAIRGLTEELTLWAPLSEENKVNPELTSESGLPSSINSPSNPVEQTVGEVAAAREAIDLNQSSLDLSAASLTNSLMNLSIANQSQANATSSHVLELQGKNTQVSGALDTLQQSLTTKSQAISNITFPSPTGDGQVPANFTGGRIRRFAAGGKSPAMVSDGEYVMGKGTVKKLGLAKMNILNKGKVPKFKNGGSFSEKFTEGLGGAALTGGVAAIAANLMKKDDPTPHVSRPDDYFQKNPLWKGRKMSKQFLLNDSRAQAAVEEGRQKQQKELQEWIAKKNKKQALGRQIFSTVANVGLGAAMDSGKFNFGSKGKDGASTFMGASENTIGSSFKNWFGGKYTGGRIQKRNEGGVIQGTPGIDRVPAMLTEGEYVINAQAARRIGVSTLDRINAGKYNSGGLVGDSTNSDPTTGSGANTNNINITVNVSSENKVSENSSQNGEPEEKKKKEGADQLSQRIKQEVITVIKEENRPGGLLR